MLFVALRNNKTVFAQGEEVAGEVTYQPGNNALRQAPRRNTSSDGGDGAPVRITVELVGYSETEINIRTDNGRMTFRGRADLLRVPLADFSGPPHTTFRFSPPFPAMTSPVDGRVHPGFRSKRTAHLATFPAIHPLPPSFRLNLDLMMEETHGFNTEYMLRASVWPILGPNGVAEPLLQRDISVGFQPRMAPQVSPGGDGEKTAVAAAAANYLVVQADHRVKSLRLSPEYQNRRLSLKEKSMSVFQRSKLPYFDFRVHLTQPATVHVGQKVICHVHLDLCRETSTAPHPPTFTLKTFKFLVEATSELHGTRLGDERCEEQLVELKAARREDLGDFVPGTGYTKTVMAALFTVPSFSTFNINRSYVLQTCAEVACVEKVYRIINRTKLTVLPALWGDDSARTSAVSSTEEFGEVEYLDGGGPVGVQSLPLDRKS